MDSIGKTQTVFIFSGDLPQLLRGRVKGSSTVSIKVQRRTSIKDMIESFGVPHTEVGSILYQKEQIDFSHIVEVASVYTVNPVSVPWIVAQPSILRPEPLPAVSFIADVNVGRLARYLRAAGIDTLYNHKWTDEYLAGLMSRENRILLTRDMRLLMRKQVRFGRYIRATDPIEQLREVLELFGLTGQLAPFTRCIECNSLLEEVAKEDVLFRLEPLTKKYYNTFSRCNTCDKIYWPGSHIEKMQEMFSDQLESRRSG